MRRIVPRAAAFAAIAVALSPAAASAAPPGTPKPAGRSRGPAAVRAAGGSENPARADRPRRRSGCGRAVAEGLAHRLMRSPASPGAAPEAATAAAASSCNWTEWRHGRGVFPVSPLDRRSDVLVLSVRRRHHLSREPDLGTCGRRVLWQQSSRVEGERRCRILVGRGPPRSELLVCDAVVVPVERHALDGGWRSTRTAMLDDAGAA